jgi:hypothetical protein
MANETRGILYETITDAALKLAIKLAGVKEEVFWNEKPEKMSITPDFTIGRDSNSPNYIVLVTASGSESDSHKKFGRNLSELFEAKVQIESNPQIINVYYKSVVKPGLVELSDAIYDKTVYVDKKTYFKTLEHWVNSNLRNSAKTKEKRRILLENEILINPTLALAVDELANDLALALKINKKELESLWQLMRADYIKPHVYPKPKKTAARRGLGKLAVIEPQYRKLIYEAEEKRRAIPTAKLPQYVFDLPFFNKSLAGSRLADEDIRNAINLLGEEKCEAILKRLPSTTNFWIVPLRDIGRIEKHADFVFDNYAKFIDEKQFRQLLLQCFNNPAKLSGIASDQKVWVFEIVVSLLKASSKRLQGYGLSQLAVDTNTPEFGIGGFLIPPFAQREKLLSDKHISQLAAGLSKRFAAEVSKADIPKLKTNLLRIIVKENLEDRLIPYRNFEPLLWLLETELAIQRKVYTSKATYLGWLNEYAKTSNRTATTPFIKVGNTLIHWKSSYGPHTNDKTKELCARSRNLKYQYNRLTKTFTRRKGVERLAIVLDGDWTERNLKALADSGWDLIIYPDEISDLVSKL